MGSSHGRRGIWAWSREFLERADKERPVADYVKRRTGGLYWAQWLQSNRYELNAMTTPQFLAWITEKVSAHLVKNLPQGDAIAAGCNLNGVG